MDLNPDKHNTALAHSCNHNQQTGLAHYSPKDKPWNRHKGNADDVGSIYSRAAEFEKLADRIDGCSGWLGFKWSDDTDTGESRLKLKKAFFCRVRYCPVCQWRRSLMWQARFFQALPKITETYPKSRWLFLTLTVRNCDIDELGDTLQTMNRAWNKFIKRKDLKPIQGWIRTTEVTRGDDRSAHPHFHVLVMVPPSWFRGQSYVKHSRWVELWKESLQVNYLPNVDIRTVKPKKGSKKTLDSLSTAEMLSAAVSETLKYSTKADDLKVDDAWFLELTRQTHKKRFLATGGVLKDVLKVDQESNTDLLVTSDDEKEDDLEDSSLLGFGWQASQREYHRSQ